MKIFLAAELPEKVRLELASQLESIRKEYPQFNWVDPGNFHVTVHYFGEIFDTNLLSAKIRDLIWDQEKFYLYSNDLDVFVNEKLVVYLYFRREKKIEELAQRIRNNFENRFTSGRKYIPHITVARGKKSSKQQYFVLKKRLFRTDTDISFKVGRIALFESVGTSDRPEYRKIKPFNLQ